jgi:hypothetical protein
VNKTAIAEHRLIREPQTRFLTAAGLGQVVDFMPPADTTATDNHRLVRIVQCVRGQMSFQVEVAPGSTTAERRTGPR